MYVPLVVTGYTLFSLLVVATLLSTTIPWAQILIANSTKASFYNITVSYIALTLGAFLPILIGYAIGSISIKSKNKLSHRFNGVLFGLLAFWIMTMVAIFITMPFGLFSGQANERILFFNLFPSTIVAIITAFIATSHVSSRQSEQDIITYKPFSLSLIVSIAFLNLWSPINDIVANNINVYSFLPPLAILIIGAVTYMTLKKTKFSRYEKIVWSAVSVSLFSFAWYVFSQLTSIVSDFILYRPNAEVYELFWWGSFIVSIAIWSVYWLWQSKALRDKL